jgi:hypothetical protein
MNAELSIGADKYEMFTMIQVPEFRTMESTDDTGSDDDCGWTDEADARRSVPVQ